MPETDIGLVPDADASHFPSKMPMELAVYLGLTGVTLGATDALLYRLAEVAVDSDTLTDLAPRLSAIDWHLPPNNAPGRTRAGAAHRHGQ